MNPSFGVANFDRQADTRKKLATRRDAVIVCQVPKGECNDGCDATNFDPEVVGLIFCTLSWFLLWNVTDLFISTIAYHAVSFASSQGAWCVSR